MGARARIACALRSLGGRPCGRPLARRLRAVRRREHLARPCEFRRWGEWRRGRPRPGADGSRAWRRSQRALEREVGAQLPSSSIAGVTPATGGQAGAARGNDDARRGIGERIRRRQRRGRRHSRACRTRAARPVGCDDLGVRARRARFRSAESRVRLRARRSRTCAADSAFGSMTRDHTVIGDEIGRSIGVVDADNNARELFSVADEPLPDRFPSTLLRFGRTASSRSRITASAPAAAALSKRSGRSPGTKR